MDGLAPSPLIVSLAFDPQSFARLNDLRRRHFPPARNQIPAHLTLFHKLPGEEEQRIAMDLARACRAQERLTLTVGDLRFMGYGTAYALRDKPLEDLRAHLAREWADWLTPQDAQPFRPHVTIQNKAPAEQAKTLFRRLDAEFESFDVEAVGLLLWRYQGGPWERAGFFSFDG